VFTEPSKDARKKSRQRDDSAKSRCLEFAGPSSTFSPNNEASLISRQLLRVLEERDGWKKKYEELEVEMKGLRERVKSSLDFLSRCMSMSMSVSLYLRHVKVIVTVTVTSLSLSLSLFLSLPVRDRVQLSLDFL